MLSTRHFQFLRMPTGRTVAVLALVLLPFPVGIPLALWLRGHRKLPDNSGIPLPPSHRKP